MAEAEDQWDWTGTGTIIVNRARVVEFSLSLSFSDDYFVQGRFTVLNDAWKATRQGNVYGTYSEHGALELTWDEDTRIGVTRLIARFEGRPPRISMISGNAVMFKPTENRATPVSEPGNRSFIVEATGTFSLLSSEAELLRNGGVWPGGRGA